MPRGLPDLARRCPRCLFPPEACLCAEVRPVPTRTRLLVVRHASERSRPTNSARWALLALPGATLVEHGVPGVTVDLDAVVEPGAALLFPSPHAPPPGPPPRQLVVVDATWAQARRMVQRLPALQTLPRLALPPPGEGRVRAMRAPPLRCEGVTTLEAIAAALRHLGEEAAGAELDRLHAEAMARAWRLRAGHRVPGEAA